MFADGEISYKVSVDGKEAAKTINSLSKSAEGLSSKFTSFGTKMTVGVTAPLTALATAGVKYNATMESYLANLTTLLGGNEQEAQKLLDTLKEMANTTPYEATDLVKATQKMMAFGISADDSLKYLNMLGDVAMGDANKMDSLTLAFSQISASGKASMEDINQMIDQGFNPLTIIAEQTGETMGELRDRVSEGGVSFEEIAGAFQTATSEGGIFYQSMDKASETTNGKISSLKDAFNSALGSMTESLLPFVTETVKGLTKVADWFANLDEDGKRTILTIAKIAAVVGPALIVFGKMVSTISNVADGFGKLKKAFSEGGTGAKLFSTIGKGLFSVLKGGLSVIKLVASGIKALGSLLMANPIALIITAIVAVIAILVTLYNKCEGFRNLVNSVVSAVVGFLQNLWNSIVSIVTTIATFIGGIISTIVSILAVPFDYVKNAFLLIVAIVATVLQTIYTIVSTVITTILSVIGSIAGWIYNNVLLPVFNFFSSVFTAIYNTIASWINTVFSIFSTIASWIYDNVLSPVFNFFKSIFSSIWKVISGVIDKIKSAFNTVANVVKSVFNNIKNFISNIFSTVAGIIKAPINGVINIINSVLKAMNKIKVPDWVPGLGGKGVNFKLIPKLATGTNYVAGDGLAYLHKGEAVVPKKYNPAVGGYGNYNQPIYVTVNADMDVNKFGKAFVRDIKTFSGGTKNSYNYGGGK